MSLTENPTDSQLKQRQRYVSNLPFLQITSFLLSVHSNCNILPARNGKNRRRFIDNESIIGDLRLFQCILDDLLAHLQELQNEFIPFISTNAKSRGVP